MKRIIITLILLLGIYGYFITKPINVSVTTSLRYDDYLYVFAYKNGYLQSVKGEYSGDKIIKAFNYLSYNINLIDGTTKLDYSSDIIDYKIDQTNLYLNLNKEFLESGSDALRQIFLTYKMLGFNKIYISIEDEKLDYFKNINISNGISDLLINPIICCNDILLSKRVIMYYYLENDEIIRYDYLVDNNTDTLSFILENKPISQNYTYKDLKVEYQIEDKKININTIDNYYLKALKINLEENLLDYSI